MQTTEEKVYRIDSSELDIFFAKAKEEAKKDIANIFYSVIISSGEVAKMHGVSTRLVSYYAEKGLIPSVERLSSKGNYKFRLSDIILLDIDKLRKAI